nr:hypothetical protein [Neobacillus sp. Marseille-Q6967]
MMTRKEYLETTNLVKQEERYKRLIRIISSKLDRDLTGKEINYIHWMASLDSETCEVFETLLKDIG